MKKNESGGTGLKKPTDHFQPKFNLLLLADHNKQRQVSLSEAVKGFAVSECRADEHDIIELTEKKCHRASSRGTASFPEFAGPTIRALNGILLGSIFLQKKRCLILQRFQLSANYFELGVWDNECKAVHVARAFAF